MQLVFGQRYRHIDTGDVCIIESLDLEQRKIKIRYELSGIHSTVPLDVMYEFFEQLGT